jgi:hypothetical protein
MATTAGGPRADPGPWPALTALTARLPAWFSWGIFECRLHRDPRVDLLLCLVRDRRPRSGSSTAPCEALAPIQRFLDAWDDDPRLAHSPLLWIEHDMLPDGASPPFVQFCVDPSYPRCDRAPLAPAAVAQLAEIGIERLLGRAPSPVALDRLAAAASRLPTGGRILHVGAMPHRGSDALRVLAAVPIDDVLGWLDAVAWSGSYARAAELVGLIRSHVRRASVQLDLGDRVGPTLAVEFPRIADAGADPAWQRFMAALVERGLAEPARAAAALSWIGRRTEDLPDAAWLVTLERQLDVKLVLGPDGACQAKAYLAFHPGYVAL